MTIKVNNTTITTLTPVNGVWTTSVTLSSGVNTLEAIGNPADTDCAPVSKTITVTYKSTTDGICVNPIALTVSSPTNNYSTTQGSVTVQ